MADDRIARLEARLLELEAEVAELRGTATAPTEPPAAPSGATPAVPTEVGRRRLLRTAVGAAVAGTAVAVGQAAPAAANDGSNVVVGATNTQQLTNTTFLNYQPASVPAGAHVLTVQSTAYTTSGTKAAIGGYADDAVTNGVYGYTESATAGAAGVFGFGGSTAIGVRAQGGRAPLRLTPQSAAPVGRSDFHEPGEVVVDTGNAMWLCVAAGTPGTWREIGSPGGYSALKLNLVPIRAYDSRPGFTPTSGVVKGPLAAGSARPIDLVFGGGVPEGATAALVNLALVETTGPSGYVKLYATGAAAPTATAINWDHPDAIIANTTMVRLNAAGQCSLLASRATHAVVDVIGYYR